MRSTEWLEANQVEVGGTVRLAFEELKVDDDGYVRSISSCPVITQGEGCVVTGTFTHLNSDVLELTFANSDLVLQPTALHPLWSEDRNDWVRAGLLMVGEHLRSESGPLEIATIQWVDGAHQVFNLEVAGNHTYLVGADAVLSHNAGECADKIGKLAEQFGRSVREVRDAIHAAKRNKFGGSTRNPDVVVDLDTGGVFIKSPKTGEATEEIGNLFDHFK